MIEYLRSAFLLHPWTSVYGPVLLVTALTYIFRVLTKLIREKKWIFLDRTYFYFGMPLLWASFGRAISYVITEIINNSIIGRHMEFFVYWGICALFIFSIHATYEMSESDLLNELKFIWERDKKKEENMGREFNDVPPSSRDPAQLQIRNLVGVASLIGLATFAIFDYLFVRALFPPL